MATAAANDGEQPDVVGQIVLLKPDDIEVGPRLRPVDPVWAAALGGIMKAEGQQTPIEVCRLPGRAKFTLVVGAHRRAGAEIKGLWLRAEVVTNDAAERKLREASENLHRRDLNPIERAAHVAELVARHRARAGIEETDRRNRQVPFSKALREEADDNMEIISMSYGWSEEVAADLGVTSRTIRNDLYLYRRLAPSLIDRLRSARHAILGNAGQLRALAKLATDDLQRRVVEALLAGKAKNVAGAVIAIGASSKRAEDPEDKRFRTVIGAIARMARTERLALVQSPTFQDLLPAEARDLLTSIRRDEA